MSEPQNIFDVIDRPGLLPWVLLEWAMVALAIVGAVLNARQSVAGLYVWVVTNAGLAAYQYRMGAYGQVVLFLTFLATSAYGIVEWSR